MRSINTNMKDKLQPHQKRLFEALSDIDSELGNSYIGALDTLDSDGRDRIAQVANSIRNIMDLTARMSGLPFQDSEEEDSAVRKVAKVLDPSGILLNNSMVIRKWNDMNEVFVDISHRGTKPTEANFRRKIEELEYFLVDFVFQEQGETLDEIDQLISKGPSGVDWKTLNLKVNKNFTSNRYFLIKPDLSG